jgi:putative endonuclease
MMKTKQSGNRAERLVAKELQKRGWKIYALNWRRPYCEIDIVASDGKRICFIEVKYRGSGSAGDGFDYVTHHKVRHMRRAAEAWVQTYAWKGEYVLLAAAVDADGTFDIVEADE